MCTMAVKQDGGSLEYDPTKYDPTGLIDREMCTTVVSRYSGALKDVPSELHDREMCAVVVMDGYTLRYAPGVLRD